MRDKRNIRDFIERAGSAESASPGLGIFVVGRFEEHGIQTFILEKTLVVNRELFGGVNRDDRRAPI